MSGRYINRGQAQKDFKLADRSLELIGLEVNVPQTFVGLRLKRIQVHDFFQIPGGLLVSIFGGEQVGQFMGVLDIKGARLPPASSYFKSLLLPAQFFINFGEKGIRTGVIRMGGEQLECLFQIGHRFL